jgi:hypothetical protein
MCKTRARHSARELPCMSAPAPAWPPRDWGPLAGHEGGGRSTLYLHSQWQGAAVRRILFVVAVLGIFPWPSFSWPGGIPPTIIAASLRRRRPACYGGVAPGIHIPVSLRGTASGLSADRLAVTCVPLLLSNAGLLHHSRVLLRLLKSSASCVAAATCTALPRAHCTCTASAPASVAAACPCSCLIAPACVRPASSISAECCCTRSSSAPASCVKAATFTAAACCCPC